MAEIRYWSGFPANMNLLFGESFGGEAFPHEPASRRVLCFWLEAEASAGAALEGALVFQEVVSGPGEAAGEPERLAVVGVLDLFGLDQSGFIQQHEVVVDLGGFASLNADGRQFQAGMLLDGGENLGAKLHVTFHRCLRERSWETCTIAAAAGSITESRTGVTSVT